MIVVTTPTGRVGSHLLSALVAGGERVRVIVRDPARLPAIAQGKVEVVQGAADDPHVVDEAFRDAESVFWCVPTTFNPVCVTDYYLDYTRPAAAALTRHGVKRVVAVSSLGRHRGASAGAVSASFAKDDLLEATGVAFRACGVRASWRTC